MLKPTSLIMGAGLGFDVACLTDGRFSGGYVPFLKRRVFSYLAPLAVHTDSSLDMSSQKRKSAALLLSSKMAT